MKDLELTEGEKSSLKVLLSQLNFGWFVAMNMSVEVVKDLHNVYVKLKELK